MCILLTLRCRCYPFQNFHFVSRDVQGYSLIRLSRIQQTRTTFTYTLVGTIPSIVILGCAEKVHASLGRLCKDLIEPPKRVFESNYKIFLHLFLVAAVIFDHLIDA